MATKLRLPPPTGKGSGTRSARTVRHGRKVVGNSLLVLGNACSHTGKHDGVAAPQPGSSRDRVVAARPWRTIREESVMVSILFVGSAVLSVLAVYTAIGRLSVPWRERVALPEPGLVGWWHTLRAGLVLLGDAAPGPRRVRPADPAPRSTAPVPPRAAVGPSGD